MPTTVVTTSDAVELLATEILDPKRARPVCVISVQLGAREPLFDLTAVEQNVGDVCSVYLIATGTLTRALDALLPPRCQVFGGAARVYPIGQAWMRTPELSPLRFVHGVEQAAPMTEKLIADALAMANDAGLFTVAPRTSQRRVGRVKGFLAGDTRAMVSFPGGELGTIQQERTWSGIPLTWVLRVDQRVVGLFDLEHRWLVLDQPKVSAQSLLAAYPDGCVTLALVRSVERQTAQLVVHPSLPITVTRADVSSNPLDRVDILLAAGDVVAVRVVRDHRGGAALRLWDVDDDDDILPAPVLVAGGVPWLVEFRNLIETPDPVPPVPETLADEVAAAAASDPSREQARAPFEEFAVATRAVARPGPGVQLVAANDRLPATVRRIGLPPSAALGVAHPTGTLAVAPPRGALQSSQLSLEHARSQIASLQGQLAGGVALISGELDGARLELGQLTHENRQLHAQLLRLRTDQTEQRKLIRTARRDENAARKQNDLRDSFLDGEEWVRHEIQLAWIGRMAPAERVTYPLPQRYCVGSRFAASAEAFDLPTRAKAFRACVDVLTGRARDLPARNIHPLRVNDGGNSPDRIRQDGARWMRAAVEVDTPSARRLHYLLLPSGVIELSRVVLHDDTGD